MPYIQNKPSQWLSSLFTKNKKWNSLIKEYYQDNWIYFNLDSWIDSDILDKLQSLKNLKSYLDSKTYEKIEDQILDLLDEERNNVDLDLHISCDLYSNFQYDSDSYDVIIDFLIDIIKSVETWEYISTYDKNLLKHPLLQITKKCQKLEFYDHPQEYWDSKIKEINSL